MPTTCRDGYLNEDHEISASLHEHTAWYPLGYVSWGDRFAQVSQGDHSDQVMPGGHKLEMGEIIQTLLYRVPLVTCVQSSLFSGKCLSGSSSSLFHYLVATMLSGGEETTRGSDTAFRRRHVSLSNPQLWVEPRSLTRYGCTYEKYRA